MRHALKLAAVVLVAATPLALTSCTGDLLSPAPSDAHATSDSERSLGRQGGAVATPFRARFTTDLAGLAPDAACGPGPFVFRNTQVGSGQATHLGRFQAQFTFCVDAADLFDDISPGELVGDESIPYWDGAGTLTAANGDELWIAVAGEIVPSSDPEFDFEFSDPFTIVGGSGRFEGATGGGTTRSFVDATADPSRTYHRWTGTIVRQLGT